MQFFWLILFFGFNFLLIHLPFFLHSCLICSFLVDFCLFVFALFFVLFSVFFFFALLPYTQSCIGYHHFFYLRGKRTYLETILFEFLKQLHLEIFFISYEDILSKQNKHLKKQVDTSK